MLALREVVATPRAVRMCGVSAPQRRFTRKSSPHASRWYNKQPARISKSMHSVIANTPSTTTSTSATDIPIKYINATGSTDFSVCVFTKNFNVNTPRVYFAAWQIIRVQSSSLFTYPISTSVGTSYRLGCQYNTMGPFGAVRGSTWEINQDNKANPPILYPVTALPNPNDTIVVKNVPPRGGTWTGRKYDVSLYKSGKLLVTQKDVHVGSQADIELQPKVFFGVVHNLRIGDIFTSLNITEALTEFDLSRFPDGLMVTLTQEPVGGQYTFTGGHLSS